MGNAGHRPDEGLNSSGRNARFISQGFETLVHELAHRAERPTNEYDFDVVIIGSGYGGSIAARRFAGAVDAHGRKWRVCVLERGREYLAGMFPTSEAQLPGHVRFNTPNAAAARGRKDALFDVRLGSDVSALVANGLGGGSLINAGVMLEPTAGVFECDRWPQALRNSDALRRSFDEARGLLGTNGGTFSVFDQHSAAAPAKLTALAAFAGNNTFRPVPLSVAVEGGHNSADIELQKCKRCGDCATGCNHRAKNSLDQNCLVSAARRGAEIFTGATVLRLERPPVCHTEACDAAAGWIVHVAYTDQALQEQQGAALQIHARRVILAAGTFGSTEILLRSRTAATPFSPRLGARFSSNGDLLATMYGQRDRVNAVANETQPFDDRRVGPTITGMIDLRDSDRIAIQEFAIPGALRRVFEESFTTANTFQSLSSADPSTHAPGALPLDPCAVDDSAIERSLVVGVMGDDGAAGRLELVPESTGSEGAIRVVWPELREGRATSVFDDQVTALGRLASVDRERFGKVLPNPTWKMLPHEMASLLKLPAGPALTVHPLGGCTMADHWREGVVDDVGRVFDCRDDRSHYEDLVVLDGSVIPCALAVNPALTISAVAVRAVRELARTWGLDEADSGGRFHALPVFRDVSPAAPAATTITILERLHGDMKLRVGGQTRECHVELTIEFESARLRDLSRDMQRPLRVRGNSRLRVFEREKWERVRSIGGSEQQRDACALLIAPLEGSMRLLDHARSGPLSRTLRAFVAYFVNRGARDAYQKLAGEYGWNVCRMWRENPDAMRGIWRLASRAGAIRSFDYDLTIKAPIKGAEFTRELAEQRIEGRKRFTYSRACNPWRQLSLVQLTRFPGITAFSPRSLELDPEFYAREGRHLMQFDSQRDHATALFEMGSFLSLIARILITTHLWSFRKPDQSADRVIDRLPGRIPGLPAPEINELSVARDPRGNDVRIRLTRYRRGTAAGDPVLMVHGFSASGTTFAHPALQPGLAQYLCNHDRDVWVLDLRTSSGLPSCHHAWRFEDVAAEDIPLALDFIHRSTGRKIDVVAHCMGAAMYSMALLDDRVGGVVRERTGKVVLSQIGPVMTFTPDNIFRAYAVSYIQHAFGDVSFELRPTEKLGSQLLDRVLATLPYPRGEFRIENPFRPWLRREWVATRHRMDAWFGCVFNLPNMDLGVLDRIDDFFGPINLRTTFQTIHFARNFMVTTHNGRNAFVQEQNLVRWHGVPTLSIHGRRNGLADVATLTRMRALMGDGRRDYCTAEFRDFGHQDCVMGRTAPAVVFPHIRDFLDDTANYLARAQDDNSRDGPVVLGIPETVRERDVVQLPWLGPILGSKGRIVVASDPRLGPPKGMICMRVEDPEPSAGLVPRSAAVHHVLDKPTGTGDGDGIRFHDVKLPSSWSGDHAIVLLVYDDVLRIDDAPSSSHWQQDTEELVGKALECFAVADLRRALVKPLPRTMGAIRFAVASCQYPAGPLDPPLAGGSYKAIDALAAKQEISFLVLAGDQVYTDATAGLMDASKSDDRYQRPYEDFLRTSHVRSVWSRLPVYSLLDDHEIIDNWEPDRPDINVDLAKDAYLKFQRAAGPAPIAPVTPYERPMWYSLDIEGLPFFFADTRTERKARAARAIEVTPIMGARQMMELKAWLTRSEVQSRPVFVVSPSILLPRRRMTSDHDRSIALSSDAWDGFPQSQYELLAHIVDNRIHNVTFLSGDEHHSCVAHITLQRKNDKRRPILIRSIHSSGLYSPYVFANGFREELRGEDSFEFDVGGVTYCCDVTTEFAEPGDGFAVIECKDRGIQCTFDKASPPQGPVADGYVSEVNFALSQRKTEANRAA